MKTFISILIACIASYLIMVATYNNWMYLVGMSPTEIVKAIFINAYFILIFGLFTRFIFFVIWED